MASLALFPGAIPLISTLFERILVLTWTTLPLLRLERVLLLMPGTLSATLLGLSPALSDLSLHLLTRTEAQILPWISPLPTRIVLLQPQFL